MYDPYGYYKAKNMYSLEKDPNIPFYEDYPINDSQWYIGEPYLNVSKSIIPAGEIRKQLEDLTDLQETRQLEGGQTKSTNPARSDTKHG